MHTLHDDEPTLNRLELVGALARACRLALAEHETADAVVFTVSASPDGFSVTCELSAGDMPVMGWGQ